jgi:hypothetical protein
MYPSSIVGIALMLMNRMRRITRASIFYAVVLSSAAAVFLILIIVKISAKR